MSAEKRIDITYKLFMVVMISIIGFFMVRLVNTIDKVVDDVERLKIEQAVMQRDVSSLMHK